MNNRKGDPVYPDETLMSLQITRDFADLKEFFR